MRTNCVLLSTVFLFGICFSTCPVSAEDVQGETKPEQTVVAEDTSEQSQDDSEQQSTDEASADNQESDAEAVKKPLVVDGLVLTDAERRVFELTNAERQKRGLPALRLDRRLMESARRQANWMARTGVFRHGKSGYAENIAMGQRSSRDVVVAWMNSSGHFRNMMNRGHGAIGVGSYHGRNGAMYWCQQFSR